jgi:hypothetical protein
MLDGFVQALPQLGVGGLLLLVFFVLVYRGPLYLERRNEGKRDSAIEKAGDWTRLREEIARLDGRCDHLQREVDDCRAREGEWMRRAITAEATLQGEGDAMQEAQRILSTERQRDAEAKKNRGGE